MPRRKRRAKRRQIDVGEGYFDVTLGPAPGREPAWRSRAELRELIDECERRGLEVWDGCYGRRELERGTLPD